VCHITAILEILFSQCTILIVFLLIMSFVLAEKLQICAIIFKTKYSKWNEYMQMKKPSWWNPSNNKKDNQLQWKEKYRIEQKEKLDLKELLEKEKEAFEKEKEEFEIEKALLENEKKDLERKLLDSTPK
jgi:hypothetical protein